MKPTSGWGLALTKQIVIGMEVAREPEIGAMRHAERRAFATLFDDGAVYFTTTAD